VWVSDPHQKTKKSNDLNGLTPQTKKPNEIKRLASELEPVNEHSELTRLSVVCSVVTTSGRGLVRQDSDSSSVVYSDLPSDHLPLVTSHSVVVCSEKV